MHRELDVENAKGWTPAPPDYITAPATEAMMPTDATKAKFTSNIAKIASMAAAQTAFKQSVPSGQDPIKLAKVCAIAEMLLCGMRCGHMRQCMQV